MVSSGSRECRGGLESGVLYSLPEGDEREEFKLDGDLDTGGPMPAIKAWGIIAEKLVEKGFQMPQCATVSEAG
ncbi:hypothetical protein M8J76_012351 [Diaphorina citri]|nr:hypothetical protein M8J75_003472 [Diaphorina citri]KAI5722707.1 hypothetical protein M8J76_012351 [Diaphorina citri]